VQDKFISYATLSDNEIITFLKDNRQKFNIIYISGDTDSFAPIERTARALKLLHRIVNEIHCDLLFTTRTIFSDSNYDEIKIIIEEQKPGKANALVTGYNSAKYELMLLCDDDNWLQPDYLKTVIEIFNQHPDIGLLGGYGKAFFESGEKPEWFDKWENCYVCGKHHRQNGFLAIRDYSIWGAGSVITKTVWNYITSSGFAFHNSTKGGKAIAEDAELSMAISFSEYKLYFDDRLWFTHDLRGGRISWKNLIAQQAANGKNNAILCMYEIALNLKTNSSAIANYLFIKKTFEISFRLIKSSMKWKNQPRQIYFFNILKELILNANTYKKISLKSFFWINKIKNTRQISD